MAKKKTGSIAIDKPKKSAKPCKCMDQVGEQLDEMGVELETALSMNFETGEAHMAGPFLSVRWKGKPKRGKRLPLMSCAYCPFCGEPQKS